MSRIGVIGAGAWGTALAAAVRRAGSEVIIQAHEDDTVAAINKTHVNETFLPGYELDPEIKVTRKLAEATDADAVLLAAPAQHLRAVCAEAASSWAEHVPAIICSKGIEEKSCALMSEVVGEMLPARPIAVLSGPTFAIEVARDLPTAVTLACRDEVVGNVLAIACGIVEGRKLGDNTRAALVTRGLAEITRLGMAKGAAAETLAGLSGLGDLTLTCNAMQSRNFSLGVALGEGKSLEEIMGGRKSVAEGVFTASSVSELARRIDVELPICAAVDAVINHGADIDTAIAGLLSRPLKAETA